MGVGVGVGVGQVWAPWMGTHSPSLCVSVPSQVEVGQPPRVRVGVKRWGFWVAIPLNPIFPGVPPYWVWRADGGVSSSTPCTWATNQGGY